MGLEIVGQVPGLDAVLVPVGGGGLIAGVAVAVKSLYPDVLVYVSYALVTTKIRRPFDARSTACHQRSLRSLWRSTGRWPATRSLFIYLGRSAAARPWRRSPNIVVVRSNCSRIAVESQWNRSCNHRLNYWMFIAPQSELMTAASKSPFRINPIIITVIAVIMSQLYKTDTVCQCQKQLLC